MAGLLLALVVLCTAQSAWAQPDDWRFGDRRDGVHLRILRDYDLPAGAVSEEPIVVIGGSATIDGRVEDDVVVIAGSVRVGPTAVIGGDVVSIGGETIVDPAAQIRGRVDETVISGPDFDIGIGPIIGGWWAAFAFGATLLRLSVILIVAVLLTVLAPDWIQGMRVRAAASPLTAAAVGVAGEVLFIPAVVAITIALVVSVIGILLLMAFPLVLGTAALMWVAGFTAVAINIGAGLRGQGAESSVPRVIDLLVGLVVISAVTLIAHGMALAPGSLGPAVWAVRAVGWLIEWLAWTLGLGAALWSLLGGRQPVTPPPVPIPQGA
jgi:hypothetical protein